MNDGGLVLELLRRTHLSKPSDLPDIVVEVAEQHLGASDVVLYLVNYEHTLLVPVPAKQSPDRPEQPVEGTMAGRSFTTSSILTAAADVAARSRMWVPLLDGTDRLGVLELVVGSNDDDVPVKLVELCERYAHVVAQTLISKGLYGDVFELVRRSRPMTIATELLWSVLPPLTFATDGFVLSTMLEPAYDNGGDAFDYAINGDCAHVAVFDGMGHGLAAAGVATFAVAAYRQSRRTGLDLQETYAAIDEAIAAQFHGERYVTAVLTRLELDTGRLSWVNAGHPPPLLLRRGRVVRLLETVAATPLGVPFAAAGAVVAQEQLEPGDLVLLYTDGLTEARHPEGGHELTVEGLAEFLEHEAAGGRPAPETLRRLRRAVLTHQHGVLQDDATALLIEWNRGTERDLMPQTVLTD